LIGIDDQQIAIHHIHHQLRDPAHHRHLLRFIVSIPVHNLMRKPLAAPADRITVGCRTKPNTWGKYARLHWQIPSIVWMNI
jgi:hypothetical protein